MTRIALIESSGSGPAALSTADFTPGAMPESEAIRTAALAVCGFDDALESVPGSLASFSAPPAALAAEVSASLEAARSDVLESARRLLAAHRRQHETRLIANGAENEWTVTCFSSGSSREEMRRTNRSRREARRSHEESWHHYQASAQQLCRATQWMVELESLEDVADPKNLASP